MSTSNDGDGPKSIEERVVALEKNCHEPQEIRPRMLDVLEEFGLVSFRLMKPEDRAAVREFRKTGKS